MDDDTKLTSNLRNKRMIELGAGRAGGYSGYDDYEFDELGGISGSSIGGGGYGYGSRSITGTFNLRVRRPRVNNNQPIVLAWMTRPASLPWLP